MTNPLRTRARQRSNRTGFVRYREVAIGRHMCRRHAGPLLAMAALILRDVEAASDIVVEAIADVCRQRNLDPGRLNTRARLAASVYRRCVGVLVARERFGIALDRATDVFPVTLLAGLPLQQRCAIALTLFGGHNLDGAARTLNRSAASVLGDLATIAGRTEARPSTVDLRVGV